MGGYGIGLGSFVGGMQQGYGLGQSIQSNRMTNQMNQIKLEDMQRTQRQKQEMDEIGSQGKADYDAAVAKGQADPQHPDEWFAQNYAPKMESFLAANGDVAGAQSWNKFANDATTKRQIRSMGSVLVQLHDGANTGDYSGLDTEMGNFFKTLPAETRKRMGTFDGLRAETDEQGKFIATASFTDQKGKEHIYTWDNPDGLRQTIEGWANPAALYAETMKTEEGKKKFQADVGEAAAKANIDIAKEQKLSELGLKGETPLKRVTDAQKTLMDDPTRTAPGRPSLDEVVKYVQDQDAAAAKIAPGIGGQQPQQSGPAAVAPKIIVNQKAAQAVDAAGKPLPMVSGANPASITAPAPSSAPSGQPAAPSAPPPSGPQGIAAGIGLPAMLASRAAQQVAPTATAAPVPQTAPGAAPVPQTSAAPGLGAAPQPPAAAAIAPGKGQPLYVATPQAPDGLVRPGNIDLSSRPIVKNPDGTISTVRSITVTMADGKAVLIPTVIGNRVVSNQEAIQHFKQSGENLGVFKDELSADQYANALHQQQAQAYAPQGR